MRGRGQVLGDSIAEGDYLMSVIVFAVTALISVLGIIFGNKYVSKKSGEKSSDEADKAKSAEKAEETEA